MADSLILDANTLKRLPVPPMAVSAMPSANPLARLAVPDPTAMPAVSAMPNPNPLAGIASPAISVLKQPNQAVQNTQNRLLGDQAEYQRKLDTGSGISQIHNPVLRTLARIGDTAGSILVPGAMAMTGGTELHHQMLLGQDQGRIRQDIGQEQALAGVGQTEANTNYLNQRPQIAMAGLQQKVQTSREKYTADLRKHGINVTGYDDETGLPTTQDDPETMAYHQAAAQNLIHTANADKAQILAGIAKNKYLPGTEEYNREMEKIHQKDRQISIAMGMLSNQMQNTALRAQGQALNEDKFYNPQPTATERNKGDLAQSANHQIGVMRDILQKRQDIFGPGGGRENKLQQWIGSSDPDAITYRTANQYLADHSAGIFGARGQYIMKELHDLTDERFSPEALNAALNEAEGTAQGFVNAGTVHGKGGTSSYSGGSSGAKTYKLTATGKDGQIGSNDGGNTWFDVKTGKAVQ